jgi:hypothetical protein
MLEFNNNGFACYVGEKRTMRKRARENWIEKRKSTSALFMLRHALGSEFHFHPYQHAMIDTFALGDLS